MIPVLDPPIYDQIKSFCFIPNGKIMMWCFLLTNITCTTTQTGSIECFLVLRSITLRIVFNTWHRSMFAKQ